MRGDGRLARPAVAVSATAALPIIPTPASIKKARTPSVLAQAPSLAPYWQLLILKLLTRVLQLKLPVVLMYSWVYQKVQSSVGSIDISL